MTYQDDFSNFVKNKLTNFYNAIKPFYLERSGGASDDSLSYFRNHYPRFECMINLIRGIVKLDEHSEICEVGSFYPYTSYALPHSTIDLFDIMPRVCKTQGYFDIDGVSLYDFNINNEKFPNHHYDLVIMSEIIEHLPVPLKVVEQKVFSILADGGYLLVTYPMGGNNAKDYDIDYGEHDRLRHEHLREFNESTVPLFFRNLKHVAETYVDYPAYGKIKLVLYQKVSP